MRVLIDVGFISFKYAQSEYRFKVMDKFAEMDSVLCWDSSRSLRRERYPWYKSNRGDRLPASTQRLQALAKQFQKEMRARYSGLVRLEDGLEADDVIALEHCHGCMTITQDHDLLQLSDVFLVDHHLKRWDISRLELRQPVRQGRGYLAYQLLTGCTTDTVPRLLFSKDRTTVPYVFAQEDPLTAAVEMLPEQRVRDHLNVLMIPTPLFAGEDPIAAALARKD